jgi:hypothetical protein
MIHRYFFVWVSSLKKHLVVAVTRGVVRYSDYDLLHSQNIFLSTSYRFERSLRLIITAVRTMKNDNVCYRLISHSVVEVSSILQVSSIQIQLSLTNSLVTAEPYRLVPCTGLRNPTPTPTESESQNQNFPESESESKSKKSTLQSTTALTSFFLFIFSF